MPCDGEAQKLSGLWEPYCQSPLGRDHPSLNPAQQPGTNAPRLRFCSWEGQSQCLKHGWGHSWDSREVAGSLSESGLFSSHMCCRGQPQLFSESPDLETWTAVCVHLKLCASKPVELNKQPFTQSGKQEAFLATRGILLFPNKEFWFRKENFLMLDFSWAFPSNSNCLPMV